jgi:hypothetical protein
MSYTNTTRLGLAKANPGTNQPFETAVINTNWDKVDAEAVAADARLDAVEGRATTIEGVNTTQNGRLTAIEANNWVTTARIADEAVDTAELKNLGVTAGKLANALDLTGKTVFVAAPTVGAHASNKTYVDAGVAATLVSANAYTDAQLGDVVVLASGSWSSSAPFGNSITTTGFRKLVLSITTTAYSGMTGLNVAFTGVTAWDTVTTTFGSTALTLASGGVLTADVTAVGNVQVFEIDYPGAAVKKTLVARGNLRFVNARSTNAAAITAFLCTPFGAPGASGTFEVIGYK